MLNFHVQQYDFILLKWYDEIIHVILYRFNCFLQPTDSLTLIFLVFADYSCNCSLET